MIEPVEKRRRPASSASAVAPIAWSRDTWLAAIRFGSTCTWSCFGCSPQMATLATPGTRRSRALIFQYVVIERSSGDIVLDVRPMAMIRLVAETGGFMPGVAAQLGSVVCAVWRRSWTYRRA